MQIGLDLTLILPLVATLFHAMRLERALGVLRRDRAELDGLIASFETATQQAEHGVERLRAGAEGAGQALVRQTERAGGLRDDLAFLAERAERAADRLEAGLKTARADVSRAEAAKPADTVSPRARRAESVVELRDPAPAVEEAAAPKLRSQAERDLLRALKLGRAISEVGEDA